MIKILSRRVKALAITSTAINIVSCIVNESIAATASASIGAPKIQSPIIAADSNQHREQRSNSVNTPNDESATDRGNSPIQAAEYPSPPPRSAEAGDAADTDMIVVTGSHIRGLTTTVGNQLIVVDREEIDRQNYATVRELVADLPQNFGGTATGERQANTDASNNSGYGSTVNLRGLGTTATLTLINGRRIPGSGYSTGLSDISSVPISAVERVEVLPDGASAVYGSDAVAGVVNFILRKDYTGLESTARYGAATSTRYDEFQIGQLAGFAWESGNIILSYEFYHADRFRRSDRHFTSTMDLRRYGGQDYRIRAGNPANILDPQTLEVAFALPENQNGTNLTPAMLLAPEHANFTDLAKFGDTFPRQNRHTAYLNIAQGVTEQLEIFIEGRFSHRKFNSSAGPETHFLVVPPNNPFYIDAYGTNQPLFVYYSFEGQLPSSESKGKVEVASATAGLDWSHSADWSTTAYVSYTDDKTNNSSGPTINPSILNAALSSSDVGTAFNPFGDGAVNSPELINSMITHSETSLDSEIFQANITTSGTLATLFNNDMKIAAGAEYRQEKFDRSATVIDLTFPAQTERKVTSLYGEIFLPFISSDNNNIWVRRLELSISGRYDRFKDNGGTIVSVSRGANSSTNPRIGLLYEPQKGIIVRGNYGTSFRAPGLNALTSTPSLEAFQAPNPVNPSQFLYGLFITGAQPELKNETADTWGAGIELIPDFQNKLNIKINYFNLDFKNQVGQPPFDLGRLLTDPAYSSYITIGPSLNDVESFCAQIPSGLWRVTPDNCSTSGLVQILFDARYNNLSRTKIQGFDFNINFVIETKNKGNFLIQSVATYIFDYKQATTPDAPLIERVNTAANPPRFRSRSSLVWDTPIGIIFNADINYTNNYRDSVRERKIGSWTTLDFGISYNFKAPQQPKLISDTSIRLTINNIFNNDPPFYEDSALAVAYDAANADPFGRLIAVSIAKKW